MRRRLIWMPALLAGLLLLVPAAPALAAEVRVVQPDGDVAGATDVEVSITREFGAEPINAVRLTLERAGEPLGEQVRLECRRGCEDADRRMTFVLPDGARFDPATGAPFDASAPLANGHYQFRLDIDRGRFLEAQRMRHDVRLAVAPAAPSELRAEQDGEEVELRWRRGPEPDLEGHRVEHRVDGAWQPLETITEDRFVHAPGEGTHRYRVVALRPDGRDGTLERASEPVEVEVEAFDDDQDDEERDRDGGRNGGGDGDDDAGGGDGGADGDDDAAGNEDGSGSDGDEQRRRTTSRSGSAQAPELGSRRRGSIPGIGEGDGGYAQELDYGGIGDGEDQVDDVVVANPGGWRGGVGEALDGERIAVPIAVGLVLTATGMHLWRWLRVPLP